jgi:hypothetical protein
MLFAVRREEGEYYPVLLLDGDAESFRDDCLGGYGTVGEVQTEVKRYYGDDSAYVSQKALAEEVERRQQ